MTRVDKINESIRYLFVNKAMSIRQIREELLNYNVDLSLVEILTIVQDHDFIPSKERKKSKAQVRLDKFRPFMVELLEAQRVYGFTTKDIIFFLNWNQIEYLAGGSWTVARYNTLITHYSMTRIKGQKRKFETPQEVLEALNNFFGEEKIKQMREIRNVQKFS